jgi:two-component system chemotaxis sensor kinase CheA
VSPTAGTREGEAAKEAEVVIVVCRDGKRHVGIAVSQVLDVAFGGDLFEAGAEGPTEGVTLLKSRVTGVIDLGGVMPLPAAEVSPIEESVR